MFAFEGGEESIGEKTGDGRFLRQSTVFVFQLTCLWEWRVLDHIFGFISNLFDL